MRLPVDAALHGRTRLASESRSIVVVPRDADFSKISVRMQTILAGRAGGTGSSSIVGLSFIGDTSGRLNGGTCHKEVGGRDDASDSFASELCPSSVACPADL